MKSFKTYIIETPHSNDMNTSHKLRDYLTPITKLRRGKAAIPANGDNNQKISSTETHDIYRNHSKTDPDKNTSFNAVNKKTNKVDISVNGMMQGTRHKEFQVLSLKGAEGSTMKAHDFYHHLIHAGHVNTLISDESQSEGAKRVWKKLSQKPNIKMSAGRYVFDGKNAEYVLKKDRMNKDFDKNYSNNPKSHKWARRFIAKADIK